MKLFKRFLHWIIAGSSVVGFLGGWALFAHSLKPVATPASVPSVSASQSAAPVQLPDLPPIPSIDGTQPNIQPLQNLPAPSFSPRIFFRTGGS